MIQNSLSILALLACALMLNVACYSYSPFKNFKECCSYGKNQYSPSNPESCNDYSMLNDRSSSCKFAFTICCSQNRRNQECERGKQHALASLPCNDLKNDNCDILTECCNCCDLGIQAQNNDVDCKTVPELGDECNHVFLECCKRKSKPNDCNTHFCPNDQICDNTNSGPICRCPNGFELDQRTNHCIDIDECKKPNICDHGSSCQNTVGSYRCTQSCGVGYSFDVIFVSCRDVNECMTGKHNCPVGMRCENYPGSFRCIREKPCGTGYTVNAYTQECEDIDECSLNLHDCAKGFICQNRPGSFKCKAKECNRGFKFNYNTGECEKIRCREGFELNIETLECEDINECLNPSICHSNEKCENNIGSYVCKFVLECSEGTEYNHDKTECIDIDECQTGRHSCPSNAECVNTPRSYKCVCPPGYKLDEIRNICEDIDECAFGSVCPSNSVCRNNPGSFNCECKTGFKLQSHIFYSCADEDECANPGICDHKCVNTYGSYQCQCNEGYKLDVDKRTCVDINECELQPDLCPGECVNTPGSYECSCKSGFQLDFRYKKTCIDIDECETRTHNCNSRDICVNTRGDFKCIKIDCPEGYYQVGEGRHSRCDRAPTTCRYAEPECLRKPMKIFYSYTSISYRVRAPIRIFTTRVNTYSRRIKLKYEFKLIDSNGNNLREDQFMVKQTESNTFDIFLLEQCRASESFQLELKIEFYNDIQFSSCLLNKIHVFVTE
ncbi:Fibulin-1 [Brachionus plicatilis]|uniref:Fibulin-1 n=1 Tax=Brachionus plicatilis TaxID=10195 RepID=A0A3M7QD37_BRAPC|nr:Fibulin-1 [Brachionus plicatilis]